MIKPAIPVNEEERLAQLHEYNILDSFSEDDYDDITSLAAAICKTPISLITLVDEKRQWFKSKVGLEPGETPREYAFCAHALNNPEEILIVPDSRKDKRFEDNPLVVDDPRVIFYTGVPLVNPDGYALGSLCVIDHKPRHLTNEQLTALKTLSKQVINLLEIRRVNGALQKAQEELEARNVELEQFASVLSHDIKSPLTSIIAASQILNSFYKTSVGDEANKWFAMIHRSSEKIKNLVDGILSYYQGNSYHNNKEKINLAELLASIISILPSGKKLEINYPTDSHIIEMNKTQLEQIFLNLLNNSIKYNNNPVIKIDIDFKEDKTFYYISLRDNGIGIAPEDQEKIFSLFTSLKFDDTFETKGYGIGLSTVKKIAQKYSGNVSVNSKPGQGSVFTVSIKKSV